MGEIRHGGRSLAAALQLAALGDQDGLQRSVVLVDLHLGQSFEDLLSLHDVSEDGVFAAQVWTRR